MTSRRMKVAGFMLIVAGMRGGSPVLTLSDSPGS